MDGEQPYDDMTPEQEEELRAYLGYPKGEEKQGVYQFFNKVMDTPDTSKVSNLGEGGELNAVRIYQSLALYANMMDLPLVGEYLKAEAEIILATSDSKKGFLVKQIGTQRREVRTKSGAAAKKSWFRREEKEEEE